MNHTSASPIDIAGTVADLRQRIAAWRASGESVALVPTMGALHEGHLSLVRTAREQADRVVVSIFVNPTQFSPNEDLARYPRTFDADCAALAPLADLVFAPAADAMYPPGSCTMVHLEGPASAGLEDRFRPTHFTGVATVVAKLLVQSLPDVAIFGEKDYQQLKVIMRMAQDLFLPVRILGGETVREPDGLAMSSRNRYLTAGERAVAPRLHAVMQDCAEALRIGAGPDETLAAAKENLAADGFVLDYLALRDAATLAPAAPGAPLRLLAAARLGETRLIDNIPVMPLPGKPG
jgi:pantoate--beta-alanine ligase